MKPRRSTRRRFVHSAVAGGSAFALGAAAAKSDDEPLLRFIQVNDLHIQAPPQPDGLPKPDGYALANEKARWLVEAINRGRLAAWPDFVVGVGDLVHGERLDRLGPDLTEAKKILGGLNVPFHPVVGNHENIQRERSPRHMQAYIDAFGANRVEYAFVESGVLFVALDNSGASGSKEAATARNAWLEDVLAEHARLPKIVLCHIPLLPVRDADVLSKSFGFPSDYDHDGGTLALVERHADTVIAVLSGHLHLTGMKMQAGITHFSLSGSASYPSDGAAVFEVFPARVRVAVKRLPGDLARSEPSIHGKPRHARDYTDSVHRTAEDYQAGTAGERTFTILLPESKRPRT
jgi:hypothetical protein